jgi:hypothetical protein
MPATPIREQLASMHDHYLTLINAAVAAGQMDLVQDLADEYEDEALELMLALEGATAGGPDYTKAEVLGFGGAAPYWEDVHSPSPWRFKFWHRSSR